MKDVSILIAQHLCERPAPPGMQLITELRIQFPWATSEELRRGVAIARELLMAERAITLHESAEVRRRLDWNTRRDDDGLAESR